MQRDNSQLGTIIFQLLKKKKVFTLTDRHLILHKYNICREKKNLFSLEIFILFLLIQRSAKLRWVWHLTCKHSLFPEPILANRLYSVLNLSHLSRLDFLLYIFSKWSPEGTFLVSAGAWKSWETSDMVSRNPELTKNSVWKRWLVF